MKRKFFGIYGKVFFYTITILLFAICVTALFFANQIGSVVERAQQEQLAKIFLPLYEDLNRKTDAEAAEIAAAFHTKNTAFDFLLSDANGEVIYQTANFELVSQGEGVNGISKIFALNGNPVEAGRYKFTTGSSSDKLQIIMTTESGGRLYITGQLSGEGIYIEYIEKTAVAVGLILLASIVGAALFARRIANPIKQIASDTKHMAELMPVEAPKERKDEIGALATDVYSMYKALKSTIAQLETEIAREREMEENQRYFFSAASHDLKTPIAAMSALIEEMIEGIAEDNSESLRKCMKMLAAQKKLVSEILEIVRLSGDEVVVNYQKVSLRDSVESVLPLITPLSESKDLDLSVEISDDNIFRTDAKMLERVLSNVMLNAVQNTPEHGAVRIWSAKGDEDAVLFNISNTGERIDEELMSKLFEPFFRLDKARSRSSGHNGLGLTIVKRTLDRLEIPFSLENTDDGVLFWMQLPHK